MAKKVAQKTRQSAFHRPLETWLYVEARGDGEGPISFAHVRIHALNEDDAYTIGPKAMRQINLSGDDAVDGHADLPFLNDYAIQMVPMFFRGRRSGKAK